MSSAPDGLEALSFPGSGVVVRPSLSAGLCFMESARTDSLRLRELIAWMDRHLVEPGHMPAPASVQEAGVGSVSLAAPPGDVWPGMLEARAARIVATARVRVAMTLSGLIAQPADDRFLSAAIFCGRVQREAAAWQPNLRGDERLSDVVLSLFAADVLTQREDYDAKLCVCDACGRVWFAVDAATRTRCGQHEG